MTPRCLGAGRRVTEGEAARRGTGERVRERSAGRETGREGGGRGERARQAEPSHYEDQGWVDDNINKMMV